MLLPLHERRERHPELARFIMGLEISRCLVTYLLGRRARVSIPMDERVLTGCTRTQAKSEARQAHDGNEESAAHGKDKGGNIIPNGMMMAWHRASIPGNREGEKKRPRDLFPVKIRPSTHESCRKEI
jgi:hypothetical protein